jgi:hypothetical protein
MLTSEAIDKAFEELRDEPNDRAVAIVGATLIELFLQEAICRRLLPMSKAHQDALFLDEYGYTFASKIDLGLSLGLYGNKVKTDLHRIKKVRNEFAHNLNRSFKSDEIAKVCRLLTDYSSLGPIEEDLMAEAGELRPFLEGREMRWRYINAISHISIGLHKETDEWVQPPKPTFLKD